MMSGRNRTVLFGAVLTAVAATIGVAGAKEQKIELSALPPAVLATAKAHAQGGEITEAELEEKNGQQMYSVEVKTVGGGELEIEIAPDGKLLKVEVEDDDDDDEDEDEQKIELSQAPAGVLKVLSGILTDGVQLGELVREQEDGVTVYEAEYKVAGVEHSLKMAASGAIVERENDVTTGSLPAEVTEALNKRFPDAEILEAEEVTVHFYEVEVKHNGKKREVKISPAGRIMGDDDDDDDDEDDD